MEKIKLPEKVKTLEALAPPPKPKGTHATITCSHCRQTWNAEENPYDYRCLGNKHHDLHGNAELVEE